MSIPTFSVFSRALILVFMRLCLLKPLSQSAVETGIVQCSPQDYFKAYGPAQLSRHFMYVLLLHALQYIGGLLISDIMHSKGISIKQTVYSVTLILLCFICAHVSQATSYGNSVGCGPSIEIIRR